jgi:hypothetical protein
MAITIQGPDGASIDFPDGTPEGEMNAAMAQAYPAPAQGGGVMGALKGASRALEANLPFVDRAVAAAKGGDYASNLQTERAKNEQFAKDNPATNFVGGIAATAPLWPLGGVGGSLAGRVGATALGSGLAGEVQGISNSPDLTNSAETGSRAAEGFGVGGALGAAAPIAAAGIGRAVSPLASALSKGPGPADVSKLGGDVKAAYQNVKDIGASYSPQQVQAMTDKIAADAADADIDPSLNPKAASVIANLQARSAAKVKSGEAVTLDELDRARQFVNDNLSGMPEPKQARFGQIIKGNIDEFTKNAEPQASQPKGAAAAVDFNPAASPDAGYVPPGSPEPAPVAPSAPPRGTGKAPIPLLDIMRKYGLQDEGGDLASMGFASKSSGGAATKGALKIIDKANGVPMDEGLRIAQELGYMEPHETVPDFIDKLGEHPTYSRADQEEVARRAARSEFDLGMAPQGALGDEASYAPPPLRPAPVAAPSVAPDQVPPAPSASEAYGAIQNARDLAQRQFKAKALANALSKAEINADVAGTGGNIENTTRRRLASIMDKEQWTPDELDQLNKMIHGGPVTNTLRQLSRFSPKGNALMGALELAGGGHPGMMAVGGGAQAAGNIARRAGNKKLLATILAGGKAPVAPASAGPSRAAFAAALAARQQLPQRQNTTQ